MSVSIPIARPQIGDAEQSAVAEVLRSGFLAQGQRVALFEARFAQFVGVAHAVAVSSGTAALHIALLAAGIKPGDEVITTPFTFIATANAISYVGATPVFADIEPASYNLDAGAVQAAITARTRAVVGVDLYGNMAGQPQVAEVARQHGLLFLEDACQAHGARIDGRPAGTLGDAAAFSFYPTKNMTTGEGGIITTDDPAFADRARLLRQHGAGRDRYRHEVIGFSQRMTEMAAAIGLVQLDRLPAWNAQRRRNAAQLHELLADVPGVVTPRAGESGEHVYHQYTVRVTSVGRSRDDIAAALTRQGVGNSIFYPRPIYRQPAYEGRFATAPHCPNAERAAAEVLSLPVHPGVGPDEVTTIAAAVSSTVGDTQVPH